MDGLLQWVKPRVASEKPDLNNFTSDWTDGVAFLALYDSCFPGEIDFNAVNPGENMQNLQRAFNLFEEKLNVPQLLKPEDVTGKYDTKKSNVAYIVMIRNAILKLEKDREAQAKLDEESKNNEEARRQATNNEHQNKGDDLYNKGLGEMNSANTAAEEKVNEIVCSFAVEKFKNMLPPDAVRTPTDAEYEAVIDECIAILDESLVGFDGATEKFGMAKDEYREIVPPHTPSPDEKIDKCEVKIGECAGLKEKYREILRQRLKDAAENDKGEKKYEEGCAQLISADFEGGNIITVLLDEVREKFASTNSDAEREPIAKAYEKKVREAADRLYDPVSGSFIEAEGLLEAADRKADCRKKLDEVEARKAAMLEEIRNKIAEEKAKQSEEDELTSEQLLQLYHEKSIEIQQIMESYSHTDFPSAAATADDMTPTDIKERLEVILASVGNVFSAKDNLRAKVHASVDLVFDRNYLP